MFFFKFIRNTNKFNYQFLELYTLITHLDFFSNVICKFPAIIFWLLLSISKLIFLLETDTTGVSF
jgi:hypothetical protein